MKHSLFKRIALCALFSLIGLAMNAQTETTVNGIKYSLNNGVATVASSQQQGLTGAIAIPEKVTYYGTDYAVTTFADNAFAYCSAITSISIPGSVISLGRNCFSGCTSLSSITIPSSVTSLGNDCFSNCTSLSSITIPSSVTSIGYNCFSGCTGLTSINVDGTNAKYCSDNGILFNKDKTAMIKLPQKFSGVYTIPSLVTSLGQGCFEGCTGLTSITIPSSVTSLGTWCFMGCTGLTSITIPSSVTSIGRECFDDCTDLTSIVVDQSNPSYCSEKGIVFNKNKTKIIRLPEKFSGAYTIPSSVTSLDEFCFEGCAGLTSIAIHSSVTNIDNGCFEGCTGLTSVTIPNSVTNIGWSCFQGCKGLTSISISNKVTSLKSQCFYGCTGLLSITIPSSVTSLENACFEGCSGLTSITIPNSVTSLGQACFYGCTGLLSITIPSSVTSLEYHCFGGCTSLTSVTCLSTTPPNINSDTFYNSSLSKATLYVPKGTSAAYKTATGWSSFGKILEVDENGTPLKPCATPVISYKEGHLTFTSETENAKCHYMITDADVNSSYAETAGDEVLAAAYHISAYATADDYNQSETATATLYWIENASTDGIEKPVTRGVFATVDGSTITLSGLTSGESVSFYTAAGVLLGTAKASGTEVSYNTNLTHQIVIVKIGKSSIKVSLK